MSYLLLLCNIALVIYIIWRLDKMASTNADVLREVGETVASNTDVLTKVTALIQAATGGLTDAQRDDIVAQLQSVQDSNAQVSAAIDAALNPSTGTEG